MINDVIILYIREWNYKSMMQKVIYCLIELPLNYIRDLTIPPFEEKRWNRLMFAIMPFTIPLLLIGIFRLENLFIQHYYYVIGFFSFMIILSIFAFVSTNSKSLPRFSWFLLILGCLVSLCWLWGISQILIDMVKVIYLLLPIEIPQTFFILTLVSVGNALPDFFNNSTLAKTGYAEMAFSGSIGSPVFGMLFGFGISIVKQNISQKAIPFDIFDLSNLTNKIILAAIACLIINLLRLLIEGFILKFRMKKCSAYIGYFIYAAFILCISYFAFV